MYAVYILTIAVLVYHVFDTLYAVPVCSRLRASFVLV